MRFAPSPTGALHIGGARTALYNWLAARHEGGELVLRIEDTDRERSTAENVEQILDALRWLELDWDEGPVSQAGRAERHAAALARLLESGAAYRDPATAKDVEAWKAEHGAGSGYRGTPTEEPGAAIRLRVPDEGETVVEDLIRGPVAFPNASYDDFVIARGDGSVLYNFAVAVDDAEMGITEVVRGDDHLSNTPKQLLVLEALGHEPPRYAHLPLLHGPDGKKLSKRHGAASVQELRDAGYLPAAVRNYLALLGWGTDDDTTLMSTEELVRRFRVERRRQGGGDLRREEAALAERPLHARAAARGVHGGGRPPPRPRARRSAARRLRDRPGESADPGRGLAADPLPLRAAGRRPEGLGEGDEGGRAGRCWRPPPRPWRRSSPSSPSRSRRRWRRCWSASTSSPASSTSRSGSRSPAARSRRASSSRWPLLGRERALERHETAADAPSGGRMTGRMIDASAACEGTFG